MFADLSKPAVAVLALTMVTTTVPGGTGTSAREVEPEDGPGAVQWSAKGEANGASAPAIDEHPLTSRESKLQDPWARQGSLVPSLVAPLLGETAPSATTFQPSGLLAESVLEDALRNQPASHRVPIATPLDDACVPHPPIQIIEEEGPNGFILDRDPATGQPIYRPGSGVVDGNGTAEDPYVIEGWCITPNVLGVGILIRNTTAHVEVRDTAVAGEPVRTNTGLRIFGIAIDGADNVTIANTTIADHVRYGAVVIDSNGARLTNNTITGNRFGVVVAGSNGALVTRNNVSDSWGVAAIGAVNSTGTRITQNAITNNDDAGVLLFEANETRIRGNDVTGHSFMGGLAIDSYGVQVTDNSVADNRYFGLGLQDVDRARVARNDVTNHTLDGLILIGSNDSEIVDNDVTENDLFGLTLIVSGNATLEKNTLGSGGLLLIGEGPAGYEHSIDASNTVNGDPIRYVRDQHGADIPAPAGQVILVNTTKARVHGLDLSHTPIGLQLAFTNRTTATDNTVVNNTLVGAYVQGASGATLEDNRLGRGGLLLVGDRLAHYQHSIDASNTVNGDPIRYVRDQHGADIPAPAGQVILVNTTKARVHGIDLSQAPVGIELAFTEATSVANVTASENDYGLLQFQTQAAQVTNNTFRNNTIYGILLAGSNGTRTAHNTIARNGFGIVPVETSRTRVANNTVRNQTFSGIHLLESHDAWIGHNEVTLNGGFAGVVLESSQRARAVENTVVKNALNGILSFQAHGAQIANNTMANHSSSGVQFIESNDTRTVQNTVAGNDYGVVLSDAHRALVADNNIEGNPDAGLFVDGGSDPVDARDNWWGASNGPSGGVEDACSGGSADGDGDSIQAQEGGEVCFEPWLTAANEQAGADA